VPDEHRGTEQELAAADRETEDDDTGADGLDPSRTLGVGRLRELSGPPGGE
jgi:hypothetical protein